MDELLAALVAVLIFLVVYLQIRVGQLARRARKTNRLLAELIARTKVGGASAADAETQPEALGLEAAEEVLDRLRAPLSTRETGRRGDAT
ncbi:hypothetical protein [Paludibacterium paludis]|uniref:Uncharacterized protein n=1 Tax=Paludibacterium paludis TaxID=1225769 RepID=A0A918P0D2_9NEIS|nr:hypothetical protein [Paludibacterium paludis]GGY09576.1 hypothetical protein GCM10011289_10500 [Paludibacterium paludis]